MSPGKINIPNPQGDSMGESLRSLLDVLEQWAKFTAKKELLIDLKKVLFVHPFFILPLCALCANEKEKGKKLYFQLSNKIEPYLNTIHFPSGFDVNITENWENKLLKFSSKTYLPVCKIPASAKHTGIREQLLTTFENILIQQANLKGQIITAVKYLISEAMDNIVEHAEAKNGWIMVQSFPQKGYIDICIADAGSGILGSYKKTGNTEITSHTKALQFAINGKSTKQITETRGYGIDTSRRMLVEGLKGKYVLFSGNALYIYTSELEQIAPLKTSGWQGTLLALQVPAKTNADFNYTTFLE
ncbi:ATP-binding protein [Mariniphaga sp.]|uniref:ATP-binding protein n=1 Tax=Mariniphaga sp. TaxID=1954475 RepID=UPI00356A2946